MGCREISFNGLNLSGQAVEPMSVAREYVPFKQDPKVWFTPPLFSAISLDSRPSEVILSVALGGEVYVTLLHL